MFESSDGPSMLPRISLLSCLISELFVHFSENNIETCNVSDESSQIEASAELTCLVSRWFGVSSSLLCFRSTQQFWSNGCWLDFSPGWKIVSYAVNRITFRDICMSFRVRPLACCRREYQSLLMRLRAVRKCQTPVNQQQDCFHSVRTCQF